MLIGAYLKEIETREGQRKIRSNWERKKFWRYGNERSFKKERNEVYS